MIQWASARAKLKREFEAMGIVRCEKCWGTFALGFAHRLKRRLIADEAELMTVALLCQGCHQTIEHSGHKEMYEAITELIEARPQMIFTA